MSSPAEQVRFCTSRDGTRIAYEKSGGGPPLLWLQHWAHHLNFDRANVVWRPWLDMLTRRHTLIRYDWRGCGLSDRDGIEFSFEKYVEDLEAVVEAAGLDRFVLFGMAGVGSGSAMAWATRHPGRVTRLILLGAHSQGRSVRNPAPEQVEERNTLLKVYELGWRSETSAYSQFFASQHMPDATAEQAREHQRLLRQTTSPANAAGMLRAFWSLDVRAIATQVQCPTLVLHVREDAVMPFEEGRAVAALIPGARFVALDGRNHIILETESAWKQLVEALDEFLLPASVKLAGFGVKPLDGLTTREHEVLELVAQALDNDAIGKQLHISKRTARNHVSMILSKLGVKTRAQAIVRARDAGFGRRGSS